MDEARDQKIKVLAVASQGGHWEQLMMLRPAFEPFAVSYATTLADLAERDGVPLAGVIPDANRDGKVSAIKCAIAAFRIVYRVRPDVVISTGALPGLMCIVAGRMIGARTLWLESIANAETLSMSGRYARKIATRCMTQWEHLAEPPSLQFAGAVL